MNDANKVEIRKKYIDIRKKIEDREQKSRLIFKKIINLEEYKNANIIAFYKSLEVEVDTLKLIEYSINKGKMVVLPRVVNDELIFYKIDSLEETFERSKFGVYEPINNEENIVEKNKIDLIVVPGVCFDIYKNRIGFGKGFYDRYLKDSKAKNVAICFDEQIIKDKILPMTFNDIKVDKIITDRNIYE